MPPLRSETLPLLAFSAVQSVGYAPAQSFVYLQVNIRFQFKMELSYLMIQNGASWNNGSGGKGVDI